MTGSAFTTLWRHTRDVVVYLLIVTLAIAGIVSVYWTGRHVLAIRRLRRGVGDTIFYARDGRPWFRLDEHRRDVPLARIAPHLREAVVAVEDHRFRRHPGVDPIAFARAIAHNIRERRAAEGGSTITQQLARTLFLTTKRTYGRKLKEAALAILLELQLSKDEILELYLNRVYMGAGAYGVETASRRCFRKPAADLGLSEAALVAGLIQSPGSLSPWTNLDGARRRRNVVLARMREEGYIDRKEEASARAAPIRIAPEPAAEQARWGYAKEYLRDLFADEFGSDHPPDWRVETTFIPEVQDAAEAAVTGGLRRLRIPGLQAALVAIDPATGGVLALVGGKDATQSPFNRAARSRRQPGSAFKPFVYAAALERGFSPVSTIENLHSVVVAGEEEWAPRSTHEEPDTLCLREALLQSSNPAAVALQQRIGTDAVRKLASRAGLADLPDVPSLALGSGLVSPLDLTAAYAIFANGGLAVRPFGLSRVIDDKGDIALEEVPTPRRVLSEGAAFQVLSMLRDVVELGTASTARELGLRHPAAGKTGTTNEFHDAWFVGFTTSVVIGVWVGRDQPAPIGKDAYGARVALPIWTEMVRRTEGRLPAEEFAVPPGLTRMEFCRVSYRRALAECPSYTEYLKPGDDVPRASCPIHRGSVKERIDRAIDRFFDALGERLRRLLGGKR